MLHNLPKIASGFQYPLDFERPDFRLVKSHIYEHLGRFMTREIFIYYRT